MNLPFLKNRKLPRIATEPREEKLVNASSSDHIDDHMAGELMDAYKNMNVDQFRSSIESLVMNMFDFESQDGQ